MPIAVISLDANDVKANNHILHNLRVCAFDHTLSHLILTKFRDARGSAVIVCEDWYDLGKMQNYDRVLPPPAEATLCVYEDCPRQYAISFVKSFLESVPRGLVISENWGWGRAHVPKQPWPPHRISYYNDEVYHILTRGLTDRDSIERAIVPRHQWQTTLCARSKVEPDSDITDVKFFIDVVNSWEHLVFPAFDGSGCLIWTPEM